MRSEKMKEFTLFENLDSLDSESQYLIHKAREATVHSYSPYSKFCVGAALILDDNTLITGSNQENASYPLCLCAERVALAAMAAMHPNKKIIKLAVVAHKKGHKELVPAAACGACRQVMAEFEMRQDHPFQVIMMVDDGKWMKCSSATALLPYHFNLKA